MSVASQRITKYRLANFPVYAEIYGWLDHPITTQDLVPGYQDNA